MLGHSCAGAGLGQVIHIKEREPGRGRQELTGGAQAGVRADVRLARGADASRRRVRDVARARLAAVAAWRRGGPSVSTKQRAGTRLVMARVLIRKTWGLSAERAHPKAARWTTALTAFPARRRWGRLEGSRTGVVEARSEVGRARGAPWCCCSAAVGPWSRQGRAAFGERGRVESRCERARRGSRAWPARRRCWVHGREDNGAVRQLPRGDVVVSTSMAQGGPGWEGR